MNGHPSVCVTMVLEIMHWLLLILVSVFKMSVKSISSFGMMRLASVLFVHHTELRCISEAADVSKAPDETLGNFVEC